MDAYKVLKRIGVGTYGSAYLVCSAGDSKQQYVLKKVKLEDGESLKDSDAFKEVQVLTQLQHPLVVQYVDHFEYKGHLCIIMEYCSGGDLYTLLRSMGTPPAEDLVLSWLIQVVLAIEYIHAQHILHRDIKTQNIFLTQDGCVKLGDMGISKPLNSSMDLASTLIGTPFYMSPEVLTGKSYDFKSDMWSFGCCLYEMMTLQHAFDATDINSLVGKILRGTFPALPQQYSPQLQSLVKALLSQSPGTRPSPIDILSLPWLKKHVVAAKQRVAKLRVAQPTARSAVHVPSQHGTIGPLPHHQRESSSSGNDQTWMQDFRSLSFDPQARKQARKAEEARQREAELLEARRAYFVERKQAEARKQYMIHGQTTGHLQRSISGSMIGTNPNDDRSSGRPRLGQVQRHSSFGGNALHELEDELDMMNKDMPRSSAYAHTQQGQPQLHNSRQSHVGPHDLQHAWHDPGRVFELRQFCQQMLGNQLFDLVYHAMKSRSKQGPSADSVSEQHFWSALANELGPQRTTYLQLVDVLCWQEEQMTTT